MTVNTGKKSWLNMYVFAPMSVSLVVLVLGAAFGEFVGIGASLGMLSSTVALAITSIIGGSAYGVTSPTGPMTAAIIVVLARGEELISEFNLAISALTIAQIVLILAAALLILFIVLRITRLVQYIPNVVVVGFVNGIAVLIALQQFRTFDRWEDILLTITTALSALALGRAIHDESHIAWKLLASTTSIVVLMSIVAALLPGSFIYPDTVSPLSIETVSAAVSIPSFAGIPSAVWFTIGILALEVALIGLFDTLLTSLLMERQTQKDHHYDREIIGQSAALLGVSTITGIPAAQSTVPSMMYYQEGAHGKSSRVMLVVFTIVLLILASRVIHFIPDAVFSGVILKIAWDIADVSSLRGIMKKFSGRNKWALLFIVVGTTVATVIFSLNAAVIGFALGFYALNHSLLKKKPIPDLVFDGPTQGLQDEI